MNASSNRGGVGATVASPPATAAATVSTLASPAPEDEADHQSPWMAPSITPVLVEPALGEDCEPGRRPLIPVSLKTLPSDAAGCSSEGAPP